MLLQFFFVLNFVGKLYSFVQYVPLHTCPNCTIHALSENDITKRKINGEYF